MKILLKWIAILLPIIILILALFTGGYALYLMPILPIIALIILTAKGLIFLSNKLLKEETKPFEKWTIIVLVSYLVIGLGSSFYLYILKGIAAL